MSVDSINRKVGIGGSQAQRILMSIGSDCVTARQVQRLLAGQVSMRAIEAHLSDLHRRGFVSQSKHGTESAYSLTSLGVYQLPKAQAGERDDWRPPATSCNASPASRQHRREPTAELVRGPGDAVRALAFTSWPVTSEAA